MFTTKTKKKKWMEYTNTYSFFINNTPTWHRPTNNNELMLHKQSNEEKAWYGVHSEKGKGSTMGEHFK